MKKIGLIIKESSEKEIRDSLKDASAMLVVKYSGVSSPDMSALRSALHKTSADLLVVKNSVARRALKDSGLEELLKSIDGPCGLVFAKDEPVAVSKALYTFRKDHEKFKIEGGCLKEKILAATDIEELSRLPGKEMLRAMAVGALNAPISGFVTALNQILAKIVYCLDQIKAKKT
ncbi:MAG: 50S ribosomal protein L10 [Candidatus Omnitrophica bacterium]|nr:50S ribosomal protein L10 [Candidatus Omnitrophota bacterium]